MELREQEESDDTLVKEEELRLQMAKQFGNPKNHRENTTGSIRKMENFK